MEVKCDYNIRPRFIDSISFTSMPVRDFPKTFCLTEIAKGYFPHKFSTDENQDYTGPYPEKSYYGYDEMKKEEQEKFSDWYETTKDKTYDFKQEMHKYCQSDVDIGLLMSPFRSDSYCIECRVERDVLCDVIILAIEFCRHILFAKRLTSTFDLIGCHVT